MASLGLDEGTAIGFERFEDPGRGHVFIDRSAALGNEPGHRDVRAGPLPSAEGSGEEQDQELHVYVDNSIVSVIASEQTAITAWVHPSTEESSAIALFVEGADAKIEVEVWEMGSI
eukprot:TRINITY_DN20005_c0_g2_i1.p5 TRINITY_DN20005_c0_g2~~TRINITY_DN20005_c0_g2_i1.p5  ORF type:complete len:116 (-),score=23.65 TRINITY_DN20005_c0_g2_i1:553-900(-)